MLKKRGYCIGAVLIVCLLTGCTRQDGGLLANSRTSSAGTSRPSASSSAPSTAVWSSRQQSVAYASDSAVTEDWENYDITTGQAGTVPLTLSIPDDWTIESSVVYFRGEKVMEFFPTALFKSGQTFQSLLDVVNSRRGDYRGVKVVDNRYQTLCTDEVTEEYQLRVLTYFLSDGKKVAAVAFYSTDDFTDGERTVIAEIVNSVRFAE